MIGVEAPSAPRPALDREALFVALVLAPATYSRNRFFEMYADHEVRRVRRRAGQLRGVIGHLARPGITSRLAPVSPDGLARLNYELPTVGLRRTIALAPLELSLLRYALSRASGESSTPPLEDPDRRCIEAALSRLAPAGLAVSPASPPV